MNKIFYLICLFSFLLVSSVSAQTDTECDADNVFELLEPIPPLALSVDNPPVVCGFFQPGTQTYVNQCSPCGRKISDDDCVNTPTPTLCDLDGFETTTGGFSDDLDFDANGVPFARGFCNGGTIENNFWIGFTAQTNEVCISVSIGDCSVGNGIQVAIVSTNCVDQFETQGGVNPCTANGIPENSSQQFDSNTLIPGQPYFIMVDGFAGDVCDLRIDVECGFAEAEFDVNPVLDAILCPDILGPPGTFTAQDGSGAIVDVTVGGAATTDLTFFWLNPSGAVVAETEPTAIFGNIVRGELPGTFFDEVGDYSVQIIDNGSCCPVCNVFPLDIQNPPDAAAAIIAGTIGGVASDDGVLNCRNNIVNILGNPEDNSVPDIEQWQVATGTDNVTGAVIRETIISSLVSSNGRINEFELTQEIVNNFFPGSEEGVFTLVYGFLGDINAFGCFGEAAVDIPYDFRLPEPNIDTPEEIDCLTNPTVELDGSNSDIPDNGSATYSWTRQDGSTSGIVSGADEEIATVGAPGFYTLVVTNEANGCVDSTIVEVLGMVDPPSLDPLQPDTLNCNQTQLMLSSMGDAGGAQIVYSWTLDDNLLVGEVNPTLDVDAPGTYVLTATNSVNGCASFVSAAVAEDMPVLSISEVGDSLRTCDVTTINFPEAQITNGNGAFTYSWVGPAPSTTEVSTLPNLTAEDAGVYTLTVTDTQSGCTATQTAEIISDENEPVITVTADPIVLNCLNMEMENTDATATAVDSDGNAVTGLTFEWMDPNGDLASSTANVDIDMVGEYMVLVTNPANGCFSEETVTVIEDVDEPDAAIADPDIISCVATMVTLQGSSTEADPVTYQWFQGADETGTPLDTNVDQVVDMSGDYALVITNTENGCTSLVTTNVTANDMEPTPAIATPDVLNCTNEMLGIDLDASGSTGVGTLTYAWTAPDDTNAGTEAMINATQVGTYTLTITDMLNGCDMTTTVDVMGDFAEPEGLVATGGTITCQDMNGIQLMGSSTSTDVSYMWIGPGMVEFNEQNPMVTATGEYTLIVTNNANGCTATETTDVMNDSNVPSVLFEQVSGDTEPISCNNPAREFLGTLLVPDPDVVLTWFDPMGNALTGNPITVDENSLEGEYVIEGFNPTNQCRGQSSVSVTFNFNRPEFNVEGGTIFCAPEDMVNISAEVIDPLSPASFTWSDPNATAFTAGQAIVSVSEEGIYTVVATDSGSGCTSEGMVQVFANNDDPDVAVAPDFDLTCEPGEDMYELNGSGTTANGDAVSFNWTRNGDQFSTDANPTATEEGTYELTVTNTVSNCMETATVIVGDVRLDPIAVANVQMELNCDTPMVLLEGDATDPDATFQWTSSETGDVIMEQSPMVGIAGEWVLLVTSDNGCTGTFSLEVEDDFSVPQDIMITGDNVLTCQDPEIQLTGSTSSMNIQGFEWSFNDVVFSTETAPNIGAEGTYTLTVIGANGCSDFITFDVTQEVGIPVATATPQDVLTCDIMETVILTTSSAGDDSEYLWSGPGNFTATTQDVTVDLEGTYTVIITDSTNGCQTSLNPVVEFDRDEPDVTVEPTTITCEDIVFNISAMTDVNNATYMWEGPAPFISDQPNPEITEVGDYSVTVTDPSNGCTTIMTLEVEEGRDLPDFAFAADFELLTCDNPEAVITATSATPGVMISFNGDADNATMDAGELTVDGEGLVSINFLNPANGCDITRTIDIMQDFTAPMPVPNAAEELNCQVIEVDISVTTNEEVRTFEWSGGPVGSLSSFDAASPTVTAPGLYTVIITAEDNGCTAEAMVLVEQDMEIPFSVPTATEITCSNPVADLIGDGSTPNVDGNISYQWEDPSGEVFSTDINTTTTVPGEYTLIVTNSDNQCVVPTVIMVEQDIDEPTVDAGADTTFPCAVDEVTLSGTANGQGNLSYVWTNEGGVTVGEDPTIQVTESGTFTLTVTDDDNGCFATDEIDVVPDVNAPDIDIIQPDRLTCVVTTVSLDASNTTGIGTLEFTWTFNNNGNETPAGNGPIIDASNPGTYTVTVVSQSNGCDASQSVNVDENVTVPALTSIDAVDISCTSGMTDVIITGLVADNPTFIWEGPNNFESTDQDLIGVTAAGDYSVTITDGVNGCILIDGIEVLADQRIPMSIIEDADMLACDTEQIQLTATTDGIDVTFSWSGPSIVSGGNTLSPIVDAPGEYVLLTLDPSNGCSSETNITVDENTNFITGLNTNPDDVNCFGPNTGSIAFSEQGVVGGTAPFLYSIDGGETFTTQEDFLGLIAGDYDVVVQDANGCEFETTITIFPHEELVIELGDDQVIAFGESITLVPQLNFDIDSINYNDTILMAMPTVSPLNTTSYEVTAFDADGCPATDFVTIFVEKTRPVFIPTGFSPDGDGINDFFTLFVDQDLITSVRDFNIFNRWGERVFEVDLMDINQILDQTNGWDGNFRNEEMNPGVFVYYMFVTFADGEEILYEGDFTLLR